MQLHVNSRPRLRTKSHPRALELPLQRAACVVSDDASEKLIGKNNGRHRGLKISYFDVSDTIEFNLDPLGSYTNGVCAFFFGSTCDFSSNHLSCLEVSFSSITTQLRSFLRITYWLVNAINSSATSHSIASRFLEQHVLTRPTILILLKLR